MADPKHTCIDPSEQKDDSQQPADTPDMASPISIYHPASLYSFTSRDIFNHDADAWPSSSSSSLWPTGHEPWQPMITTTSSAFESSLGYDTSLPFPDPYLPEVTISEIDDGYYGNSPPPTSEHSGTARSPSSTTSSGLPVGQYSVSSRIVTKEDIQSDPLLRDAIQTVSEYRKSRRRAQNRAAQQAFKARKQKREKELNDKIKAIEANYARLQGQNKALSADLQKIQKDWKGCVLKAGEVIRDGDEDSPPGDANVKDSVAEADEVSEKVVETMVRGKAKRGGRKMG